MEPRKETVQSSSKDSSTAANTQINASPKPVPKSYHVAAPSRNLASPSMGSKGSSTSASDSKVTSGCPSPTASNVVVNGKTSTLTQPLPQQVKLPQDVVATATQVTDSVVKKAVEVSEKAIGIIGVQQDSNEARKVAMLASKPETNGDVSRKKKDLPEPKPKKKDSSPSDLTNGTGSPAKSQGKITKSEPSVCKEKVVSGAKAAPAVKELSSQPLEPIVEVKTESSLAAKSNNEKRDASRSPSPKIPSKSPRETVHDKSNKSSPSKSESEAKLTEKGQTLSVKEARTCTDSEKEDAEGKSETVRIAEAKEATEENKENRAIQKNEKEKCNKSENVFVTTSQEEKVSPVSTANSDQALPAKKQSVVSPSQPIKDDKTLEQSGAGEQSEPKLIPRTEPIKPARKSVEGHQPSAEKQVKTVKISEDVVELSAAPLTGSNNIAEETIIEDAETSKSATDSHTKFDQSEKSNTEVDEQEEKCDANTLPETTDENAEVPNATDDSKAKKAEAKDRTELKEGSAEDVKTEIKEVSDKPPPLPEEIDIEKEKDGEDAIKIDEKQDDDHEVAVSGSMGGNLAAELKEAETREAKNEEPVAETNNVIQKDIVVEKEGDDKPETVKSETEEVKCADVNLEKSQVEPRNGKHEITETEVKHNLETELNLDNERKADSEKTEESKLINEQTGTTGIKSDVETGNIGKTDPSKNKLSDEDDKKEEITSESSGVKKEDDNNPLDEEAVEDIKSEESTGKSQTQLNLSDVENEDKVKSISTDSILQGELKPETGVAQRVEGVESESKIEEILEVKQDDQPETDLKGQGTLVPEEANESEEKSDDLQKVSETSSEVVPESTVDSGGTLAEVPESEETSENVENKVVDETTSRDSIAQPEEIVSESLNKASEETESNVQSKVDDKSTESVKDEENTTDEIVNSEKPDETSQIEVAEKTNETEQSEETTETESEIPAADSEDFNNSENIAVETPVSVEIGEENGVTISEAAKTEAIADENAEMTENGIGKTETSADDSAQTEVIADEALETGEAAEADVATDEATGSGLTTDEPTKTEETSGEAVETDVATGEATETEVIAGEATETEVTAAEGTETEETAGDAAETEVTAGDAAETEETAGDAVETEVTADDAAETEGTPGDATETEVTVDEAAEVEISEDNAAEEEVTPEEVGDEGTKEDTTLDESAKTEENAVEGAETEAISDEPAETEAVETDEIKTEVGEVESSEPAAADEETVASADTVSEDKAEDGETKEADESAEGVEQEGENEEENPVQEVTSPTKAGSPTKPSSPTKSVRTKFSSSRESSPEKTTKGVPRSLYRKDRTSTPDSRKSDKSATSSTSPKKPTSGDSSPKKSANAKNGLTSPSKSARTPSSDQKKLPPIKAPVGQAPSPKVRNVKSKIGSLDNIKYKPGGGDKKVNKVMSKKLEWSANPKVGSMDNATHKPGGGDKKIQVVKVDFKDKAQSKVGSKDLFKHTPGGGQVKVETHKIDFKEKAASKVGSMDNVKHKAGGGNVQIKTEKLNFKERASPKIGSLAGSDMESFQGSNSHSPVPLTSPTPTSDTHGSSSIPPVSEEGEQERMNGELSPDAPPTNENEVAAAATSDAEKVEAASEESTPDVGANELPESKAEAVEC